MCNSGNCNHYKSKLTGDTHCRGVRIVFNSTFTAGGVSAPIFVTVYGLTKDEMPNDTIITIKVPGLVAGGHQDLYSVAEGFVSFVRGNDGDSSSNRVSDCDIIDDSINQNTNTIPSNTMSDGLSKESRVASLYRRCVYYPFNKND